MRTAFTIQQTIRTAELTALVLVLIAFFVFISLPRQSVADNPTRPPICSLHIPSLDRKSVFIDVDKFGQLAIDGKFVSPSDARSIKRALQSAQKAKGTKDISVFINCDEVTPRGLVGHIIFVAAECGIKKLDCQVIFQTGYY